MICLMESTISIFLEELADISQKLDMAVADEAWDELARILNDRQVKLEKMFANDISWDDRPAVIATLRDIQACDTRLLCSVLKKKEMLGQEYTEFNLRKKATKAYQDS